MEKYYTSHVSFIPNNIDKQIIGKRVRCIDMKGDNFPLEKGVMGTIRHVGYGIINVDWDNGRSIGLVIGLDEYEIMN